MTMSQAAFSIQGRKPKRVKTRSLWQIGIAVSDFSRTKASTLSGGMISSSQRMS